MGQKISPVGFRVGIIKDWDARWYAEKDYVELLHEDLKVRDYIKKQLDGAGVSRLKLTVLPTTCASIFIPPNRVWLSVEGAQV